MNPTDKFLFRIFARLFCAASADRAINLILERFYYRSALPSESTSKRSRHYQILCYHKVTHESHPFFKGIEPIVFEGQMRLLQQHYRVLPLRELVERSNKGDVPAGAVAITFDDGYSDNYLNAFPILRKYNLPATIYLATGCIGNKSLLWHDRVFDAFRFATVERACFKSRPLMQADLSSQLAARESIRAALRYAKGLEVSERIQFVEGVEEALRPDPDKIRRVKMLDWKEVKEMSVSGICFGSHTVTHPILTRVTKAQLKAELEESKAEIENRLGVRVEEFAYPNGQLGDYNPEVKAAIRESGYASAVTTRFGFNVAGSDPHELRRGQPWYADGDIFRLNFLLQRHGLVQ